MTATETNGAVACAASILFPIAEAHLRAGDPAVCHCPACDAWDLLYNADPERAEGLARRWDAHRLYALGASGTAPVLSAPPGDRLPADLHADDARDSMVARSSSAAPDHSGPGTSQKE